MTRSYKPDPHLEASAQELLESLNGLILREAHQVSIRRRSAAGQVSFSDILDILEKRQVRGRHRERGTFAIQVIFTATAVSSAVISLAIAILAVSSKDVGGGTTSLSSLFVTVLLTMFLILGSATLLAVFRDPREGGGEDGGGKRPSRRSRHEDERELLKEWLDFENFMTRELYGSSGEAPVCNLSGDIVDFSRLYDLDPEEIRSILRVRNAVVYDPKLTTPSEIRKNLLKLRLLLDKLSPVREFS